MAQRHARFLLIPFLIPASALVAAAPAQADDADAASTEAADTPAIIVTTRAQQLYRVEETEIGKVPAKPLDIAQSVQVINSDLITDQGARDITDLYRNVPGVSANNYATVTYRGFTQDVTYYDGLRGDPFQTFSVPQLFTIERVEFLKGPAGMLYGAGSPGGTINYVTKKPQDTFAANTRVIVGGRNRYGASGDVTGPLDAKGVFDYRAALFYEDYDSYRAHASSRTFVADGGLTAHLAPDTKLTTQVTNYNQNLPGNRLRGIPIDADGNFLTYRSWNHNDPDDYIRYNGTVVQSRLDSKLNEALSFNLAGRWFNYDETQKYHEPVKLLDTDSDGTYDTVTREYRDQHRKVDGLSFGANLVARFDTGALRHTVLAGADWYRENSWSLNKSTRDVPSLSLTDPDYSTSTRPDMSGIAGTLSDARALRKGIYLQERVDIGEHVILTAGLRHDWFDDSDFEEDTKASGGDTTWRAGAIYKPRKDVSLYFNWSQSFVPQDVSNNTAAAGGPFDPETGFQYEVGAKSELFGGKLQATLAAYRIVRRNVLQVDDSKDAVDGVDQLAPLGEVTSKGIEATLATDITRNWVVTANYAYNDTRITGTAEGQSIDKSVGDRFPNTPHHQAGFWTRYQVAAIDTAFALGGQYVSDQIDRSGDRLKPFTVFDASVTHDFKVAQVMFRIENIFDKYYAVSGFTAAKGAYLGNARSWFIELRKAF
ncbi:TonB-dependent siderophore receptor [Novosphingobium sp. 1949]|uniref:TonB-dependent siderophore receptor n=1 Tax=Novosphingobium organovorum TaxID=2930092 RepID=A0ABT0BGH3_9SPHN|nr:TonB-dependent siderophore receptor [Novosphingobium organovorum]MCJ2184162.1 TonB-dependent siderophore receptor [Novosphingobium organovorum]